MIYTKEMIEKIYLKKEKRKKILKLFFLPIFIGIIFFVIDVFFQKFIQKEDNIDFFGIKPFIIMTGSMEPSLNIGDMIISKHISQNEIQIGDIITFCLEDGKETVTHRIIDITEQDGITFYQTKGDNNNSPDPELVKFENIVGKYDFKIKGVGNILSYIFTATGIIVIGLIMLLHYTISNERRIKVLAREEARRLYNIPRYKKENNQYDNI